MPENHAIARSGNTMLPRARSKRTGKPSTDRESGGSYSWLTYVVVRVASDFSGSTVAVAGVWKWWMPAAHAAPTNGPTT